MKIQQVAIALIKKDNKYLLTKRVQIDPEDIEYAPFVWHFPGGRIEINETAKAAIKREIKEELDVFLDKTILIPKTFVDTRGNWQGIFTIFLCTLKDLNQEIILNDESDEYGWFTLDEIKKLKTLPFCYEMANEADKIQLE